MCVYCGRNRTNICSLCCVHERVLHYDWAVCTIERKTKAHDRGIIRVSAGLFPFMSGSGSCECYNRRSAHCLSAVIGTIDQLEHGHDWSYQFRRRSSIFVITMLAAKKHNSQQVNKGKRGKMGTFYLSIISLQRYILMLKMYSLECSMNTM